MESDQKDPKTYSDSYFQQRNPVTCEGLVQLTLGAPLPHYNGGLLISRLRYFDAQSKRPGLPPDVSALVSRMTGDETELQLVNLSRTEARDVIIQAGAMGEHKFIKASFGNGSDIKTIAVKGKYIQVHLPPFSQIMLDLHTQRFVNNPSYKLPW